MTASGVRVERGGELGVRRMRGDNGAYRRLWSAVMISETGDWLLFIALPLYVLQVSGSALATSTVFLAELLPTVVIGTVSGPVIDRRDPGRLLAVLTMSQAGVLMPLLWLGSGELWIVYVVAALQAAITSITTPAHQALIPRIVQARDLPAANGMVEMAGNVARLVGSPLGGLLLPVLGLDGLVICDAVSFVVSAALLGRCGTGTPGPAPTRDRATGRLVAFTEGWRSVRSSPSLMSADAIAFVAAVAQGLFLVLFVLFVLRLLHAGDGVVGLLRGVQAVGGVLGGLVIGRWAERLGARALTIFGLAAFGLISLITWNSPAFTTDTWWYVTLFVAVGIPSSAFVAGLITEIQRASPRPELGRVLSLTHVAQALGQGAGILAAGLLGGSISLTVLLNVQAGCYLACAVIAIASFGRHHRATLCEVGPAAADYMSRTASRRGGTENRRARTDAYRPIQPHAERDERLSGLQQTERDGADGSPSAATHR